MALGRMHPSKGYLELAQAAVQLAERIPGLELHHAGPAEDAGYGAAVEAAAAPLGMRFVRHGNLAGEAKRRFIQEARVLCLPSHGTENFGNVVIEALASGVPVVASRATPWAHLDETGCGRWTARDPASLASALAPYLEEVELAEHAGLRGRALVEARYRWDAVARGLEATYRELACGR